MEKELLAIMWALIEFRSFIYGIRFTIRINVVADALSRIPYNLDDEISDVNQERVFLNQLAKRSSSNLMKALQNFAKEQANDPVLQQKWRTFKEKG